MPQSHEPPAHDAPGRAPRARLPRGVWALGIVSLCMDTSSEMIHSLLPVFLVSVLGASTVTVGAIEGIGSATASISKLFSGWLSDRLGRRKRLAVAGYGLAALSKPFFAVAPTAVWVLGARFADRLGKGIRGAPRDALVGDLTPPALLGAAYGLRQSLDTVGAFAGPLVALVLMETFDDNFRLVFWVAVAPAIAAVLVLVRAVREPAAGVSPRRRALVDWAGLGRLGRPFWMVVTASVVLTLARFSEAFLILRAETAGLALALTPLVLVVMNIVSAGASYPAGVLSDRFGRRGLVGLGFAILIAADVVLAAAPGIWTVFIGVMLWGLHLGMTDGLLSALVADTAPAADRGAAFGLFSFATGVALLVASLVAGTLWELVGPSATFLTSAAFTGVGLAAALVVMTGRSRV
jgi:MFS family permease